MLEKLEKRFNENMKFHSNLTWNDVAKKIDDVVLKKIKYMEETGGEPDVIDYNGKIMYVDTCNESPLGRRSLCYDEEALNSRKANKPLSSAMREAELHNVELLDEEEYKFLQTLGDFDTKSTSWIKTPKDIRNLGGAIFGDKKYGRTFIYHNGAESYYSNRGFRVKVEL